MLDLIRIYVSHGAPCLFHLLTGYYCPGCGGTRSVRFFLHGDLFRSLLYHPVVLYTAAVMLYALLRFFYEAHKAKDFSPERIFTVFHPAMLWTALIIVGVNFAVKNIALYFGVDLLTL